MLALEPAVLMLDEPTADMSIGEVPVMLEFILRIKQQEEKTIIPVEHKLDIGPSLARPRSSASAPTPAIRRNTRA